MPLFLLVVLALVQGITEFLPVSSSAHLVLAPWAMGEVDQGPLIDVMAHLGTLVAVLIYFREDVIGVVAGMLLWLRGKTSPGGRLALLLIVATPPGVAAGAALYLTGWVDYLRDPFVIAIATLVFALPLWLADRYAPRVKTSETMTLRDALIVGLAQILSFIPGASRSGVTMTAARAVGLQRAEAARFSMLMSVPIIAALGAAAFFELARGADPGAAMGDGLLVALIAFAAAYAVIAVFMKVISRIGFLPFVIYRVGLGVAILAVLALS